MSQGRNQVRIDIRRVVYIAQERKKGENGREKTVNSDLCGST